MYVNDTARKNNNGYCNTFFLSCPKGGMDPKHLWEDEQSDSIEVQLFFFSAQKIESNDSQSELELFSGTTFFLLVLAIIMWKG